MAVGLGGLDPYRRAAKRPKKPAKTSFSSGARAAVQAPRPGLQTKLPGRFSPPKPVVAPKPTVKPAAPPRPDFEAWYRNDPRWKMMDTQFQAGRAGLYGQYGLSPMIGADGKPVLDEKGHPRYNIASGDEAPFSLVNQLAQAFAGQSQNLQDSANSRGLLFSGAQAQGQQNLSTQNDQRFSDMTMALEKALGSINQDQANLINELYPDYLATAPPANAAANPAAAAAAKAKAEADRQARIKKAQDHLRQDKLDAARRKKKPAPKKTTTGKKATIGSGASSMRGIG